MKFSLFRKHAKEAGAEVKGPQSRDAPVSKSPASSKRSTASPQTPVLPSPSTTGPPTSTDPRVGRARGMSNTSPPSPVPTSGTGSRWTDDRPSCLEQGGEGKLKLRVVLDPTPTELDPSQTPLAGGSKLALKDSFYIYVDTGAAVEDVKEAIHKELGSRGMYSLGCYKVQIPLLAHHQAKTYTKHYGIPVHLLAHFPAYNMFDASHLTYRTQEASGKRLMGSQGISAQPLAENHKLKVGDWWPQAVSDADDSISVIVRLGPVERSHDNPMTFLAHFSNGPTQRGFYQACNQSPEPTADTNARPPLVFELARHSTVDQLKSFVLQAEGKDTSQVDKVTIWRVDMSWEEMLSCEAFGGLRDGGMPWPYPPNAPSPVALDSSRDHLSDFFPERNVNTNLVSMYVWIDPKVEKVATASGMDTPFFSFPMSFATPVGSRNHTRSRPNSRPQSQSSENITTLKLGSTRSISGGGYRPVTAPAAIGASLAEGSAAVPVKPHAFGSRSTVVTGKGVPRSNSRMSSGQRSPLSEECFKPVLGLAIGGIPMAGPVMQAKLSISSDFSPEDSLDGTSPRSSIGHLSRTSSGSQSSGSGLVTPPPQVYEALPDTATLKLKM